MTIFINRLVWELFKVMAAGNLIFLLLEWVKPRSVLAYLNLNTWLAIWLAGGIIVMILTREQK